MSKINVCVVGYGNVGQEAVECINQASDMHLAGIVEVRDILNPSIPIVKSVEALKNVDVAVLTVPSRVVPKIAPEYLSRGINTVDGFDIHGDSMLALRRKLDKIAKINDKTSIIGAGWDPGINSITRILFSTIAPHGITYTNYGPGMSMGHSVAAKDIDGVKDAVSMTLPLNYGQHRRDVYVEIEESADFEEIAKKIKEDPYFVSDTTIVTRVNNVLEMKTMGHGASIERIGASGTAHNQRLRLELKVANPSATAQIMVSAARATMALKSGCYTLAEIPPVTLLPGDREYIIGKLI